MPGRPLPEDDGRSSTVLRPMAVPGDAIETPGTGADDAGEPLGLA
jgi:hypothetical protein